MTDKPSRFRDAALAKRAANQIRKIAPSYPVKICHVCGTHEWTISHHGLRSLLPETVDVIAGPGCPVCIVPAAEIDEAITLALNGVTITTFGDLLRVPGSEMSLQEARAQGGDVRIVYSVSDAAQMAKKELHHDFAFFAIGFETTAPSTAVEILNEPSSNLSFLVSHRLIPPAMELLLGIGDLHIDGFIAPGHVSTIIGMKPYEIFPEAYHMPTIVAGFEPLDVLFTISMLLQQIRSNEAKLENEYRRVVAWEGNVKAQRLMEQVFDVASGRWRGLGKVPASTLALKEEFAKFDARKKYNVNIEDARDLLPGCLCHLVMIGKIKPSDCKLYMKQCTPQTPRGACMVSMEGTCSIWAKHERTTFT
ncbi:hydrogenase formation protein HypD [Candidatus Bathyarchaeota archaeon]|nr:hydrogenase formation protein HypD [Candidatus Bathyarchaeota archaeon]NIV43462.1 hydrogenase formation protein HypD [Candidatus Bathyarchaeota archaeon]